MAHILIIGCGKLGRPLGVQLATEGHIVTGVRRSIPADAETKIQWQSVDICAPQQIAELDQPYDQITIILTPASRSPQGYSQIYQDGLGLLLDHLAVKSPNCPCLFVSATSVYGQQDGTWVDEHSATEPGAYNGKSLLAAEKRVAEFSSKATSIRFSGIYGTARTRVMEKLKSPQQIQQNPPLYTNRIHQSDCIGVLHHFINKQLAGDLLEPIYVASDHDCAPKFEVMCWLAERAGLIAPTALTGGLDADQNKRCRNQRLLESGYSFRFKGFQDGYSAMLDANIEFSG